MNSLNFTHLSHSPLLIRSSLTQRKTLTAASKP
jgi:hypothetical protein